MISSARGNPREAIGKLAAEGSWASQAEAEMAWGGEEEESL
jgi:hypothetical protein